MKDGDGNVIQSYTYDSKGQVTSETDSNGTSYYTYDSKGNVIESKDADGSITKMEYNTNGNLTKMTEADGSISTFTYDKEGRELKADYGDGIYVNYGYTGTGGDWTSLDAPTIGHIERKFTSDGKLGGWVTPDGGKITFQYDAAGRLSKEIDPTGRTTEYSYDTAGRLISTKDSATGAIATKKYDAGGRVIEEVDPLLVFTRYTYHDKNGKLIETVRGKYVKDASGNLVEDTTVAKRVYKYEYNGSTTTVIDPLGRKTTSVSDEYYLPTETIYSNGSKESVEYLYNNNLQEAKDYPTKVVDIAGRDRHFTYDSLGRLKTATDLGTSTYSYAYGNNGLSKITSPLGETLKYAYNEDNLTKVTYGDGSSKQMSYRATDNRLDKITLPDGKTITYDYDTAGRTISQTGSDGVAVSYTYTTDGQIATMTDGTGVTNYSYDSNSRLSKITRPNGSSIAYTYDSLGRTKTITEKGTATGTEYVTEYGYDAFGNLSKVRDPSGGVTTMKYDIVDRLVERVLPNGVKSSYAYDELDRVVAIIHAKSNGTVLASQTYERKGIGEPTKITNEDGSYVSLEYDGALRVTKESYYSPAGSLVDSIAYNYDADGKRIKVVDGSGNHNYNYDAGYQLDKVVESGETKDYQYDVNGRLTGWTRDGSVVDLEHDSGDRLKSVTNSTTGNSTQYIYDGNGNRVKEIDGSNVKQYLVAPNGEVESTEVVTDGNGQVIGNYVYAGGNSPFMMLDSSGNPVYYLTDAMGSVIGLADGSGSRVGRFVYDGFGNIRSESSSVSDVTGGDFRFQGQWRESESGLYYFHARDYDAKSGLFTSRDAVEPNVNQPESFNPYGFVANNPYIYSDPTGMFFTITEFQAGQKIQNILQNFEKAIVANIQTQLRDEIKNIGTDFAISILKNTIPFVDDVERTLGSTSLDNVDNPFENAITNTLCNVIRTAMPNFFGLDYLWFKANISKNGTPTDPGINPSSTSGTSGCGIPFSQGKGGDSKPELIIKKGEPTDTSNPSYLLAEVKTSINNLETGQKSQHSNFVKYATGKDSQGNKHMFYPTILYVSLYGDRSKEEKLTKKAFKQRLVLEFISFKYK